MRRPVAAPAAVALLAALAACTADPPAGADGDLSYRGVGPAALPVR